MTLKVPALPRPRFTRTLTSPKPNAQGYSPPVIGNPSTRDAVVLFETEYVQHASGGAAQLLTTDYGPHRNWEASDCAFRFVPAPNSAGWPNGGRWCWRIYNFDGVVERCLFAAAGEEHGFYGGIFDFTRFKHVTVRNCGSQGLQFSLKAPAHKNADGTDNDGRPASSPSWSRARTLSLEDVNLLECGRPGGTRLGFVFSLFEHGPRFELLATRVFLQTVKQSAVLVDSGGNVCDSTGGYFLGFCARAELEDCSAELKRPEKGLLQAFDYNTLPPSDSNAPQALVVSGGTWNGGFLDVRLDETPNVRIERCKGNAKVRLWHWKAGKWQVRSTHAVTTPYSQGAA